MADDAAIDQMCMRKQRMQQHRGVHAVTRTRRRGDREQEQ